MEVLKNSTRQRKIALKNEVRRQYLKIIDYDKKGTWFMFSLDGKISRAFSLSMSLIYISFLFYFNLMFAMLTELLAHEL